MMTTPINHERLQLLKEFGLEEVPFRPDADSPEIDIEQLRAFATAGLPEEEGRQVASLVVQYRPWRDAYQEILLEEGRKAFQGEQETTDLTVTKDDHSENTIHYDKLLFDAVRAVYNESATTTEPTHVDLNRELVTAALIRSGYNVAPNQPDALKLLVVASLAVQQALIAIATEQLADVNRTLTESDTQSAELQHTTVAMSQSQPKRVLKREHRLKELDAIDSQSAQVYRLSIFAGCTNVEIASMMEAPVGDIEEMRLAAIGVVYRGEGTSNDD